MTNEEAIANINMIRVAFVDPVTKEQRKLIDDTLDTAIKALEQQPCERFEWGIDGKVYKITKAKDGKEICQQVCDDAISREELLKAIDTWDKFGCDANTKLVPYKDHYIPYIHYDDVIKCIKGMPPVTPQQKYGKWILADEQNKEDVENDNYRFICSECQCSDIHAKGTIVPYCWKCGAKMQESEEV